MEAIVMEENKVKNRFAIFCDHKGIKADSEPFKKIEDLLNELVSAFNETDFKLESIDDVEQCLASGPTVYVKELAIAKIDQKTIGNVLGIAVDRNELLKLAAVPEVIKKADRIADRIHEAFTDLQTGHVELSDFDFAHQKFSIKPSVTQRIVDAKTRYAANKTEEALVKRLKEMVAQFNELRSALVEYQPGIYSDSWTHPEALFQWDPLSKSYEVDLKLVANIFKHANERGERS